MKQNMQLQCKLCQSSKICKTGNKPEKNQCFVRAYRERNYEPRLGYGTIRVSCENFSHAGEDGPRPVGQD